MHIQKATYKPGASFIQRPIETFLHLILWLFRVIQISLPDVILWLREVCAFPQKDLEHIQWCVYESERTQGSNLCLFGLGTLSHGWGARDEQVVVRRNSYGEQKGALLDQKWPIGAVYLRGWWPTRIIHLIKIRCLWWEKQVSEMENSSMVKISLKSHVLLCTRDNAFCMFLFINSCGFHILSCMLFIMMFDPITDQFNNNQTIKQQIITTKIKAFHQNSNFTKNIYIFTNIRKFVATLYFDSWLTCVTTNSQ